MTTGQQELDLRVLEYVYEHDSGTPGGAGLAGLRDLFGNEATAMTTNLLRERGLIRRVDRQVGGFHITALGRTEIETLRARQTDRAHRRIACRELFLCWVDTNSTTNSGDRIGRERFDGAADFLPFTDGEVVAAADFLAEHQLINSISASGGPHILVWITEIGRECIDYGNGISSFLDRNNGARQSIHVSGSGNNIAAAFGDNNEVSASLSNFNLEAALTFAAAVREAVPALPLPPEANELIQIIEDEGDLSLRQKATYTLYRMIETTATGALGGVLAAAGARALGIGS